MQYRRVIADRKICALAALGLLWSLAVVAWSFHAMH
jgi:hypothetical protein